MNNFEKIYQIDPQRENDYTREKHPSIELSDLEHLKKNIFINEPSLIPKLEKVIKKGKKIAKIKNKSIERKPKKINSKSKQPAVESIQAQL